MKLPTRKQILDVDEETGQMNNEIRKEATRKQKETSKLKRMKKEEN